MLCTLAGTLTVNVTTKFPPAVPFPEIRPVQPEVQGNSPSRRFPFGKLKSRTSVPDPSLFNVTVYVSSGSGDEAVKMAVSVDAFHEIVPGIAPETAPTTVNVELLIVFGSIL